MNDDARMPDRDRIMELLAAVCTVHYQEFATVAGQHGLTSVQAKALALIGEPTPMRGLARQLVCDASNITGIVDRLEARGLAVREPSPADRRVKNVVATEAGQKALHSVREGMRAAGDALDVLDGEERAALFAILSKLRPVLERSAAERVAAGRDVP